MLPSHGPFRYFWGYVVLAVLLRHSRSLAATGLPARTVWAGSAAWLAGVWWSFESAVFVSAIWLPAYALLVWQAAVSLHPGWERLRARLAWGMGRLLLPVLLLAGTAGLLTAYYFVRLGHGPDWAGIFEYPLSFQAGFGTITPDSHGPVWVLFLVFCVLAAVVVRLANRGGASPALVLGLGALAAFWATSSYFMLRGHANNATNHLPAVCAAVGVALFLLTRNREGRAKALLIRAGLVPVLTVVITAGFGNPAVMESYAETLRAGPPKRVAQLFPPVDASLASLLDSAPVRRGDPVAAVLSETDFQLQNLLPALGRKHGRPSVVGGMRPAWLPTSPLVLIAPLPRERTRTYLARFRARDRRSGWLVRPNQAPDPSFEWFYEELKATHTPGRVLQNDQWQLIWYERRATN
jgi:hypothetical protein